jgi:predicted amidohydrolase YtcJ
MRPFPCALFLLAACSRTSAPDAVIVNGKIFTADSTNPWAEALAIRGDRISALGPSDEIRKLVSSNTRVIDAGGRAVVPGFNDAHDHVSGEPPPSFIADPAPIPDPSARAVLDSVRAVAGRVPAGSLISSIIGPTALLDPALRRAALDAAAPAHRVQLVAWSGHGYVVNSAELAAIGVTDSSPDPLGGFMERGRDGRLTGLMMEYGGWSPLFLRGAEGGEAAVAAGLKARGDSAIAYGITSIQTMSNGATPATWKALLARPGTDVRLRLMPMPGTTARGRVEAGWDSLRSDPVVGARVAGLKYVIDGTPVEGLAFMREPYSDLGSRGMLNFPADTIRAILRECATKGYQPILHIVGDSATAVVLSLMSEVAPDSVWRRLRPRIEHGEGATADLIPDLLGKGVIVVQNPTHFAVVELFDRRWGTERRARQQLFKSYITAGVPIAIGSDGPQHAGLNLMLALMHPDNPAEALTMEEAVTAYTRGSAYAEFAEADKGTLSVGKLADLAILSQDIFTVPVPQVIATRSVVTIIGGKVVLDQLGN